MFKFSSNLYSKHICESIQIQISGDKYIIREILKYNATYSHITGRLFHLFPNNSSKICSFGNNE